MTSTTTTPASALAPRSSSTNTERTARDSFWIRIAADLAEAIARGVYSPGQRLPSEHALAEQFGVNRHTIRRSLANLCSQGLLRVTQGSGTYVEEFAVDLALAKRPRFQRSMALAGLRGALRVTVTSPRLKRSPVPPARPCTITRPVSGARSHWGGVSACCASAGSSSETGARASIASHCARRSGRAAGSVSKA